MHSVTGHSGIAEVIMIMSTGICNVYMYIYLGMISLHMHTQTQL